MHKGIFAKMDDPLESVTTINEVVDRWHKTRKTVERQLLKGKLRARRSAGTWLIKVDDVIALWGHPDGLPRDYWLAPMNDPELKSAADDGRL